MSMVVHLASGWGGGEPAMPRGLAPSMSSTTWPSPAGCSMGQKRARASLECGGVARVHHLRLRGHNGSVLLITPHAGRVLPMLPLRLGSTDVAVLEGNV